ncbi:MAG: phosphatidate cytidylyltransferase [Calditrichia bacterium]
MKDLGKRLLVAVWGIPLILGLSFLGGYYFLIFLLVINGMALWEFYSIFQNKGYFPYRWWGLIGGELLLLGFYFLPASHLFPLLLLITLPILFRHLRLSQPSSAVNTLMTLGGLFYISTFLGSLLLLRQNFAAWSKAPDHLNAGGWFMLVLWLSIWACDTFAYFGGLKFGKHKLAPNTSPNKTIEGAVFGFLGGVLVFAFLGKYWLPYLPTYLLLVSGFLVGTAGQLGDLIESRFKRDAGVKDTSTLLPGHGGFYDRFDSLIFISPFLYLLFGFLGGH